MVANLIFAIAGGMLLVAFIGFFFETDIGENGVIIWLNFVIALLLAAIFEKLPDKGEGE